MLAVFRTAGVPICSAASKSKFCSGTSINGAVFIFSLEINFFSLILFCTMDKILEFGLTGTWFSINLTLSKGMFSNSSVAISIAEAKLSRDFWSSKGAIVTFLVIWAAGSFSD